MSFSRFLPRRLRTFLRIVTNLRADNREEHELTAVTSSNGEPQPSSSFATNNVDSHGIRHLTIMECENLARVFELFSSNHIQQYLTNTLEVLLIKFEISNDIIDISAMELLGLASTCSEKSIVIFLQSTTNQKCSIYWKSSDIDYCLILKTYFDEMRTSKLFFEFVAEFLSRSLRKNHLGIHKSVSTSRLNSEIQLHLLVDQRGYNLMMAASELGNEYAVKFLLISGFSTEFYEVTAQSIAYSNKHSNVLLVLFNWNKSYPIGMDVNECSQDVQNFVNMCIQLHEYIRDKKIDKIDEIIKEHKHLRHFYDLSNQSAAVTALKCGHLDIYEYFTANGIYFGPDEITDDILREIDNSTREIAQEIHFRHKQELPESHINTLLSSTTVNHDADKSDKTDIVRQAYTILNNIAFIRIILMVVAAARKFSIIFDFNRDSIHAIDPTSSSSTTGTFYTFGRIYIGARQLLDIGTRHQVLGTLAHELCHFALNLTYRNEAKPYTKKDKKRMQVFKQIYEKCKIDQEKEDLIKYVYNMYSQSMHHAELAVRVPHLLALYHNQSQKLEASRENFKELFEFIEENVGPDMEKAIPGIKKRSQESEEKKQKRIIKLWISLILAVILGIGLVVSLYFILYTPTFEFGKLSKENQEKIQNANVIYKNVTVKFSDLYPGDSLTNASEALTSNHIARILNDETLNFNDPFLSYLDELIVLKWNDLAPGLKEKVLKSKLIFQEKPTTFENLYKISPEDLIMLDPEEINSILSGKEIFIGRSRFRSDDVYTITKYLNRSQIFGKSFLEFASYLISRNGADNEVVSQIAQSMYDLIFSKIDLLSYVRGASSIQKYLNDILNQTFTMINLLDQAGIHQESIYSYILLNIYNNLIYVLSINANKLNPSIQVLNFTKSSIHEAKASFTPEAQIAFNNIVVQFSDSAILLNDMMKYVEDTILPIQDQMVISFKEMITKLADEIHDTLMPVCCESLGSNYASDIRGKIYSGVTAAEIILDMLVANGLSSGKIIYEVGQYGYIDLDNSLRNFKQNQKSI